MLSEHVWLEKRGDASQSEPGSEGYCTEPKIVLTPSQRVNQNAHTNRADAFFKEAGASWVNTQGTFSSAASLGFHLSGSFQSDDGGGLDVHSR